MSLNIYYDESCVPADMKIIEYNDSYFDANVKLKNTPIPCIEFATLLMLADLGVKLTCGLTDLYNIISGIEIKKYTDKSLEKYLKRLLNSDVKKCIHNIFKKGNYVYGLFYNSDCACDQIYSSAYIRLNRDIKGKTLFEYTTINTSPESINKLYENISKALDINAVIKY